MNIDKNELIEILKANTARDWSESDVSDRMLATFNKEYAKHLKVYPGYDPLATEEYRGKQDDEFLKVLMKTAQAGKQDLGFGVDNEEYLGESLVEQGWPEAYGNVKKFNTELCEDALDLAYGSMSWDGVKSVICKFPERAVQVALNNNHHWASFKNEIRPYITKLAAFCLGPKLDGDLSCWSGYSNGPAVIRDIQLKDLKGSDQMVKAIMEAFTERCPMSPATKAAMRHEILPNLHVKVYESSFEMDAGEFADIAAALNSTAASLAEIVHGFVSKAITKAREKGSATESKDNKEGTPELSSSTDGDQEMIRHYQDCVADGHDESKAIASVAAKFNISPDTVRKKLTASNVNLGGAANTTAQNNAATPAASNDPNAAASKEKPSKQEDKPVGNNPFTLHVNKQYQTASGQVLTLRKMSVGQNPALMFEDDSTGEKVEMLQDKFLNMNPTETNIDTTKSRVALINKFKRRINLSAMKHTAKIIYKTKTGRKVYENLDSIKSGGKPVGDIAGVSIGTRGNGKNQIEYVSGNKIKAGDITGTIKGFKVNENEEPEIIVKTPEGDEVTITVADFEDAGPEMATVPLTGGTEPVEEHVEYKGYSLLQNAEDQTWSILQGEEKIEGAEGMTEEEAKAWVDAQLEEEGGTAGGEEDEANESISRRFIKESKGGSIQLKTFSEVLAESNNTGLRRNLVPGRRPATAAKIVSKK